MLQFIYNNDFNHLASIRNVRGGTQDLYLKAFERSFAEMFLRTWRTSDFVISGNCNTNQPKRWILCAALVLVTLPKSSMAQESVPEALVTDRPDFTESTETVKPGRFQLEGGYTFTRIGSNKRTHAGRVTTTGRGLAELGTADWHQLLRCDAQPQWQLIGYK